MASALLVIDVQTGLIGLGPHDPEGLLARIASLQERARKSGTPVFFVRHAGVAGDVLAKGTDGWQIHPRIGAKGNEQIIDKEKCSSFLGTNLEFELKRRDIDHLIICGMCTDFCVDTTIRSAFERGFKITAVSDTHSTMNTQILKASQVIAHHNFIWGDSFATLAQADQVKF
jgi:nicotinamidase-related amidase